MRGAAGVLCEHRRRTKDGEATRRRRRRKNPRGSRSISGTGGGTRQKHKATHGPAEMLSAGFFRLYAAYRGALRSAFVREDLFRRLRRRDMVPLSRNEQTWWTVYGFFATLSEVFFTSVRLLSLCSGTKVVLLHDFRPGFVGQCPLSSRGLSPVFSCDGAEHS